MRSRHIDVVRMRIVISSGKGGTGKTLVATNVASAFERMDRKVTYLDCDVEEPDGHLFLKPVFTSQENVTILSPVAVDPERCTACGKCGEACTYNAIAVIKDRVLFFPELCHACGACTIVCPTDAIIEEEKKIGTSAHGKSGKIEFHHALLETGSGGMSPRLVREVKKHACDGINILDSSPGTACPVAETVRDADLVVLVTDPTPFGINDLKLAANMTRRIGGEPVVLVNRAGFDAEQLEEYCEVSHLEVLGEIPDDRRIAETYSSGDLIIDKLPEYRELFFEIARKMESEANKKRPVREPEETEIRGEKLKSVNLALSRSGATLIPRELVIISGKGGTGKTSIAAAFAALAGSTTIADCDVDAPDLHLLLDPDIIDRGPFSGGVVAKIDPAICTACGKCAKYCRFDAIVSENEDDETRYRIDPVACEGCGVCHLVCEYGAISVEDAINGEWFVSETRFGPMAHAELCMAEENSGRLVTLVRQKAAEISLDDGKIIIDGAPGTGCPVIASLTAAKYALVVTESTVSGVFDMSRILDVTRHFGIETGIVINKYDLNHEMVERIRHYSQSYDAEILGMIPYESEVTEAQMQGLSVIEYDKDCSISKEIIKIWERIVQIIS